MELKGQIEEFIYQNEANSYTIAVFQCDDGEVLTVVGFLPFIAVRRLFEINRKNGSASRIWRAV